MNENYKVYQMRKQATKKQSTAYTTSCATYSASTRRV